jgi:hypothetical protein
LFFDVIGQTGNTGMDRKPVLIQILNRLSPPDKHNNMFREGFYRKHGFIKIQHVLIRIFCKIPPHKSISVLYQSVRHTALSAANRQNPTS